MHIWVRCSAHLNLAFLYVHLYSIWLFNSLLFLVFFVGNCKSSIFCAIPTSLIHARHSHSCIHMILWFTLDFICATFFIIRAASSHCHCTLLLFSWWSSSSYEKKSVSNYLKYRSECIRMHSRSNYAINSMKHTKKRGAIPS